MIKKNGNIYPRNRATLIIATPMRTPTSPPTTLGSIFSVIECKTNVTKNLKAGNVCIEFEPILGVNLRK